MHLVFSAEYLAQGLAHQTFLATCFVEQVSLVFSLCGVPCFFCAFFLFFSSKIWGIGRDENSCFFGSFLAFFQKNKGRKDRV